MAATLTGADCSWPSKEEISQAKEIRCSCFTEIQGLTDPTRDVVGDIRLCRFLRFYKGDVKKATKGYKDFLIWRKDEDIETLRKGVIDLAPADFISWIDSIRSPLGPAANFNLGETADGHQLIFASPGFFKAADFVKQRPACHTMDTDLLIIRLCIEYILKRLDDRSYALGKMLYTIKVADMKNMGKEKLPIFVSEIRNLMKTQMPQLMQMYCEHDILILVVNAPFAFRVLWTFVSSLISKRQADRVKVFGSLTPEVKAILSSLAEPDVLPSAIGGTRTEVPMCFPLAQDNPKQVAEFMARTKPGLVRGQAPASIALVDPSSRSGKLEPSVSMTVDSAGNASSKPSTENARGASEELAAKLDKMHEKIEKAEPKTVQSGAEAASADVEPQQKAEEVVLEAETPKKSGIFCCSG